MLKEVGAASLDTLIDEAIPAEHPPQGAAQSAAGRERIRRISRGSRRIAKKNNVFRSFIGLGYYDTLTPERDSSAACSRTRAGTRPTRRTRPRSRRAASSRSSISRRWSRDLTGMAVANASLLDEGTAAGEAMALLHRVQGKKLGDAPARSWCPIACFPQTLDVLRSRAEPLGIELRVGPADAMNLDAPACSARSCSIPTRPGASTISSRSSTRPTPRACKVAVATDLLALALARHRARWAPIRVRQLAALRRAARIRRSARGVLRHQPGIRAPHAGPRHRRLDGRAGPSRLPHVAADARAAHPPREGDLEHLHRAGAARQHGGDVCGLSRARGHQGDRDARPRHGPRARRRAEALGYEQQNPHYFDTLRIDADAASAKAIHAAAEARASTSATSATPRSASRSTKPSPWPTWSRSSRSSRRRPDKGAGTVGARLDPRRTDAGAADAHQRVPDAPGVQRPSLRERDDALHPQPRAQGRRPRHVDDPARLLHDEAERRERDVSRVVAGVLAHAPVRAGRSDRRLSADLRRAGGRRSARSPALPRCRCSRTPARKASSPAWP